LQRLRPLQPRRLFQHLNLRQHLNPLLLRNQKQNLRLFQLRKLVLDLVRRQPWPLLGRQSPCHS
jgi:hypothetical protein